MFKFIKFIYWFYLKQNKFSQGNEENIINSIFIEKNDGFFIDVGSYNPKRFSNTATLYRKGWSGINIDADKKNINLFNFFRARDLNLNFFISNKIKEIEFCIFNERALNGIHQKKRLNQIIKNGYKLLQKIKMKTETLDGILKLYYPKLNHVDLLDIDVEGHDFEVLQSINLDKINIKVILIEVGNNELKIDNYLEKFGYNKYIREDRNKFYLKKKV